MAVKEESLEFVALLISIQIHIACTDHCYRFLNPSTSYQVIVTTRNAANGIIDGPTQSTAYTIKQIGTNVIADNAITTDKIAPVA